MEMDADPSDPSRRVRRSVSLATRKSIPRKDTAKGRPLSLSGPETRIAPKLPQTSPNKEIPNILRSQLAIRWRHLRGHLAGLRQLQGKRGHEELRGLEV